MNKKILSGLIIISILLTFSAVAYASTTSSSSLENDKIEFLEKMQAITEQNNSILNSRVNVNEYKSATTFTNITTVEEVQNFINELNLNTYAVYLKFTEPDGTIGTGYQVIEGGTINMQHINQMENMGFVFEGVTALEAYIDSSEYLSITNHDFTYIVSLSTIDEKFPESYYWDLEKFGLN